MGFIKTQKFVGAPGTGPGPGGSWPAGTGPGPGGSWPAGTGPGPGGSYPGGIHPGRYMNVWLDPEHFNTGIYETGLLSSRGRTYTLPFRSFKIKI